MSVYRDKKRGVWVVDVTYRHVDGREERVRRTSPVQTRRGAEQQERDIRVALQAGTFEVEARPARTLDEVAKEYFETARTTCRESTIDLRRTLYRLHLAPAMGSMLAGGIGTKDVDRLVARLLELGYARATICQITALLRRILQVAMEWGEVPAIPTIRRPPREVPREPDFLTFEEADRLVKSARPGQDRTLVLLALRTGMRVGEIVALEWGDVDMAAGKLVVRRARYRGNETSTKSGKAREIPLAGDAWDALREHRHLRSDLVFCDESGSPLKTYQVDVMLRRTCRLARLRAVGPHCLRHTFASHLVMRGAPMKAVQELLGHGSLAMTMRYSHLAPECRREVVDLLGSASERQYGGNGLISNAKTGQSGSEHR